MKLDILIIKLLSSQIMNNPDMLKFLSRKDHQLLRIVSKKLIPFVFFIFGPIAEYAQIVLEKEIFDNNYYKLQCSLDESRIIVSDMEGKKTISYQGFVDPSRSGEMAFPSFDIYVAIPRDTKPIIEFIPEESKTYNGYPELNPGVSVINSQTTYIKHNEFKNYIAKNSLLNNGSLWIGNNYCVHLKLNLFQLAQDAYGVKLIKKFMIQLRFNSILRETKASFQVEINPAILNKTFAQNSISKMSSKVSDSDSWIDYNSEYIKIGTNKDAVYRIGYNDLIAFGTNLTSIDPRTFKLFLKGKEIPIYIHGEGDGSFDNTDFIEFAGLRNMGGNYREISKNGEPYKEYINRYSDTTIYWLTWNGDPGLRVVPQTNKANISSDTLKYYSEIIHVEHNNWYDFAMQDAVLREMPYWAQNKTWNEGNLGVGTRNITFQLKDVYPNAQVKVFSKLQDYASNINLNAHLLAISLNNASKQDSGYVSKYQQKVLQGVYNSNLLKEGSNSLNLYSFTTPANPNLCIVDWYEMEYPRYLKAINDSLNFQFHFLNGSSVKNIYLTNLNNTKNYSIWKYGTNYKKYHLKASNGNILIADTIKDTDKFVLIDSVKTLKPKIFYKKLFVNLRNRNNSADYIAITNKKFISTASDYASFISHAYNVKTKVIDADDIYDEFAYGFFMPESIRDFLITTHTNWRSPAPNYVILIGGATYDYLGNKTKYQGAPPVINYVPSFGAPVSDNWFVIWDTTGAYIPQMNIGRLPVTTNEELVWYLQKHQNYVFQKYSSWNKRYIFFSGGTGNDQNQLDIIKNVNDYIISNYVTPSPIGGKFAHFYKTINPSTNFGPYTVQQIQTAVDSGGVFIAYLGHSGTQTWDNSITDPGQLKNKVDRSPLITDFGCSTAKFAEPDIISFSQLFVDSPNGQAIAYIGNSSLGFASTAYTFPKLFYKKILADSVLTIGDAHRLAKIDLINNYGTSSSYTLFILSNTLIGDPIVRLDVPAKPDLSLSAEDIKYIPNSITDSNDSVAVSLKYFNYGRVKVDTFTVAITSGLNQSISFNRQFKKAIPLYSDSLTFSIPVKNQPGEHTLRIVLDSDNKIDELSKSNNEINLNFFVASSAIKMSEVYTIEGKLSSPVTLLNPVSDPLSKNFRLEISANNKFSNPSNLDLNFDTLVTKAAIPGMYLNKRVWIRNRLNNSSDYGNTISFICGTTNNYSLSDSLSISTVKKTNIRQANQKLILDSQLINIKALSAGFNDGNTALIQINNQNLIPENTLRGHHIVVLNDSTYKFVEYQRFDILGDPNAVQNYINFLDTLSTKYLVVFAISDEGSISSAELKQKIKLFGSKLIDQLGFRGSWAMIGKKGAKQGTVPEAIAPAFRGRVQVDTTITTRFTKGSFVTTKVGPTAIWKSISISDSIPSGATLNYRLIGIKKDESADSLNYFQPQNGVADVSSIDSKKYPFIKVEGLFNAPARISSPVLKSLEVNYTNVPELATNYQIVSISRDTLTQGEKANLSFYVYNVGESRADSFKVRVDVVKPDNSREKIFEQTIDSLGVDKRKLFNISYNTASSVGNRNFYITIDPDNKVLELYKDNNLYTVPFYVKGNNSPALLKLTFDGNDIINGDYVSSNPNIRIALNDQSQIPITDTSHVQLYLNSKRVSLSSAEINFSFSDSNPKFVVNYKPTLSDGTYTLKVMGTNATGQLIDSVGVVRKFMVSNQAQLLYVYNYPNPFSNETFFTFKLTQIPEELKIKVFTINGRNVKTINVLPSNLNYDFNRIEWDGRDEDGDLVANGVYLYKVIMKKGNETVQVTQKLAIVR